MSVVYFRDRGPKDCVHSGSVEFTSAGLVYLALGSDMLCLWSKGTYSFLQGHGDVLAGSWFASESAIGGEGV